MALISFSPLQDGVTGVNAAATNTPLSTIYNDYNGNITDANIAAGAAIAGSKINIASVANPYKFSVYRNSAWSTPNNTNAVVQFDTKLFDTGANVDIVTNKGRFTAPIAGFYYFNAHIDQSSSSTNSYVSLYKNGSEIKRGPQIVATNMIGNDVVGLLQLAATDYVEVYSFDSTTHVGATGSIKVYFDGHFVSAT